MSDEHKNLKWMLMLYFLSGVLCTATWKVVYKPQHICAVNGSTVVLSCSFRHPKSENVESVKWSHGKENIYKGPFIYDSELNNTSSRFAYIGDRKKNCSFKIHSVEPNDAGIFAFRFTTMSTEKKPNAYTGNEAPELKIVELKIDVTKESGSDPVKEGDSLNLTCTSGCDDGTFSSDVTWFKEGNPIIEGPVLSFPNISSTHSGNYSCSLKAHNGTSSKVTRIDVGYGPKNTSVSVAPSEEVDAGCKVTLICSSHANPPAENYTWFKMHNNHTPAVVGRQHTHHLKKFSQSDEGRYFCSASNKHGSHNSSVVTLKLKVYGNIKNVLIIAPCVVALLTAIAVITVTSLCKRRTRPPETEPNSNMDTQNEEYINWPMSDTTRPEESPCEGEIIYTVVIPKRKSDALQQMDSHDADDGDDDEGPIYSAVGRLQQMDSHDADDADGGVIYSTVCRIQTIKP